ncbi:MAG: segregation/condensation protein A, partial [Myxococcota bacterium]
EWIEADEAETDPAADRVPDEPLPVDEFSALFAQEPANVEPTPPVAPRFPKERRRGRTAKPIVTSRSRAGSEPSNDAPLPLTDEVTEVAAPPVFEEAPTLDALEVSVEPIETEEPEVSVEPAEMVEPEPEPEPVESEVPRAAEPVEEPDAALEAYGPVYDPEWVAPVEAAEAYGPIHDPEWVAPVEADEAYGPIHDPTWVATQGADEATPGDEATGPDTDEADEVSEEELAALEAELSVAEEAALAAAELDEASKPRRRSKRERLACFELQCWRQLAESEIRRRALSAEPVEVPNDYVPMVESRDILFQLNLSSFEGPLDLLLFLIRRHKIDIFDIPIGFISAQYLRYIKMMEDLNIDVASEFLFMASELLHIKSRMLLPKPAEVEDEDDIDPRAELVQRLLEYQKYKQAASQLGALAWLGRDTFPRAPEKLPPRDGEAPLKEVGVFALIEAFNRVLERQKPEVRHQVLLEQVSVRQRIKQVIQQLADADATPFEALLEGLTDRVDVVVTFLACLEMGKRQLLKLYLSENETLYLQPRFDDIEVAMGRLEGLDEHEYA